ncbi:MAG TPA: DUF692 family protein [Roseiflexaceae bacterium]|nr:DUF692 family protein [Roseiflexaceae bacterium]
MIALAVSDFDLPRALLAAGQIDVDYLETGGHYVERTVAQFPDRPLLLHNSVFNWSLAHPTALEEQQIIARTLQALEHTRAPWLSVHLGFSAAEVIFDVHMNALSPALPREELLIHTCGNVRALADAIPMPLILENLDYCAGGAYEHICEPAFIAAVLEQTGAGLLLDLAHAQVSASRMGVPIERYLEQLPLDRVRQLHISGPRPRDGMLYDAHEVLLDRDYALLEWVLRRTEPLALTLEYNRDEAALRQQLMRLRELLRSG